MVDRLEQRLTGSGIHGSQPLAVGPEGIITWQDFLQSVEERERMLAALNSPAVAIQHPEPCEFLASLWATWRLGKIAVISANNFRDLHSELGEPPAEGICLTSFDDRALPNDRPETTALVLYTSGSTGTPQPVPKTLAQLDAELSALDQLWGDELTDTLVVNLVSHHHMFGLPFGLLWPLMRGTPFHTRTIHYPEPLEKLAQQSRLTLVCSPVHLQHLPDKLQTSVAQGGIGQVFSAGSPLAGPIANRCRDLFGRAVTEIYGSTETGAIAWREHPDDHWQCLAGVTIDHPPSADGSATDTMAMRPLRIASPALPGGSSQTMADLGRIHSPTSFSLGGRLDRIAKVGGKRVSLSALESRLLEHHWVRAARVLLLPERKGRLGAVIVLEPPGTSTLIDKGRKAVSDRLKSHMAGAAESIALPRYWRYVSRLPANSLGKSTAEALVDLFLDERQSRFPILLDCEKADTGQECRLTLHIPDNLYYFNGHFPGHPILPGVVQTHWAIHYARQELGLPGEFAGLEAIKFQHIIRPGALVTLELQWSPDSKKLQFSYYSAQARHSSGRVLFVQEPVP